MKSRFALTVLLVAGFMLSTTGATLAISGSSGDGSASSVQYGSPGGKPHHEKSDQGVKGVHGSGGNDKCSEGGNGSGGNGGNGGKCSDSSPAAVEPAAAQVEVAPATAEQQAVVSSGSSLPFTGFVAIPLLIIGLALIVVGAVIRLKSRNEPVARP